MDRIVADVVAWLRQNPKLTAAGSVPGASPAETAQLFALGGFANPLVHPRGRSSISSWPAEILDWVDAPSPPPALARTLRVATQESPQVLASIYESVVRAAHRRQLGTFFTPAPLVTHMLDVAERIIGGPPNVVVDPGAGVGAFTVPAAERWRTDAVAVDVNPVTLGLLGVASAIRGLAVHSWPGSPPIRPARRVHLVHDDFLSWIGAFLQMAPRRPVLVIGNPPYTRHQSLTSQQKTDARKMSGDLVSSGLAGLSSYFLATTLRHLRADDALVMLLPSNWLTTRYARETREHIWALHSRHTELHLFPSDLEVFPGTQVAATILAVGPRREIEQPFEVVSAHLTPTKVQRSRAITVRRREPMPADFSTLTKQRRRAMRSAEMRPKRLDDLAIVRRGVATGANAHYFVTDEALAVLPPDALCPAIVRLKGFATRDLTASQHDALGKGGASRWLVDFHAYRSCDRNDLPAPLSDFVDNLERLELHRRYLLAVRGTRWWVPEVVRPADLLIGPMTKEVFKVVKNDVGAVHSNTLFGLTLRDRNQDAIEGLRSWMETDDGQAHLTAAARRHATGLLKLEPGALKMIELPLALSGMLRA